MNKSSLISSVITAIVVAAAMGIYNTSVTTMERGSDALTEDQIRAVLKEENIAIINGESMTYGEALNKISVTLAVQGEALKALASD